jgi:beta-xylosidase
MRFRSLKTHRATGVPTRRAFLRATGASCVLSAGLPLPVRADIPARPAALKGRWGDQGDGRYVNPVIPADYSDIDVIRAPDGYYAISSTLHTSPGMAILHSDDLVNWTQIGHAVPDISKLDPALAAADMQAYGHGVWAGALRRHKALFYIYFTCPDSGLYVTTAAKPEGPWSAPVCLMATQGFDDPCPFWDDDGQAYLVTTRFAPDPATGEAYIIYLYRMSADGLSLDAGSAVRIHQSAGSEANKLYKFNGLYYHYYSEVRPEGRVAMMERASSLSGPWRTRQLNHVNRDIDKEPNQGGFVTDRDGRWWFLTHQGSGDWEGRALCLLPVSWRDGWPIIGQVGADGVGVMVWEADMPGGGSSPRLPDLSDDFASGRLSSVWEWNHQPQAGAWRIEAGGGLRLTAVGRAYADFDGVRNILSQRSWRTSRNSVRVELDITDMRDGQIGGLCHFADRHAFIGVEQSDGERRLVFRTRGEAIRGPVVPCARLKLSSHWDIDGRTRFCYELEGGVDTAFGAEYQLDWGHYRGDRVGLFTFNDVADAGSMLFRSFVYEISAQNIGAS